MKAEEKPKYVSELREIISKLDIAKLISLPDQSITDQGVLRAKAIFTNFDHGTGEKLEALINEFLEVARAGKRTDHIRNLANDIKNFIIQKTEEIDVYGIRVEEKSFLDTLSNLKGVQKLINDGLARPEEKTGVLEDAKQKAKLFQDELYRRKAEKIGKITIWSKETHDGFVAPDENSQIEPWINLFADYLGQSKIKRRLEGEGLWIQSNIEGEDEHLFVGKKNGKKDKVHLVVDGGT